VGKPEGKRPLSRPRHRWVDKINLILRKYDRRAWVDLISFRIQAHAWLL